MRVNFGLLSVEALQTNEMFTMLLVTKASKLGVASRGKSKQGRLEELATGAVDKSPSAQGISNSDDIAVMLDELSARVTRKNPAIFVEIITQDFDVLSFDEQIALVARSSILIGVHGTGIAVSMHMPVGTKYCCGVIEIFPGEGKEKFKNMKGHGNMARRMGHQYERLDISKSSRSDRKGNVNNELVISGVTTNKRLLSNETGDIKTLSSINIQAENRGTAGIYVPPTPLKETIASMIDRILKKPSCFLPAVVKKNL